MTAQINDRVFHRKAEFSIAGIHGSALFEPKEHGIEPGAMSSACWRGYYVSYGIADGQLFLTQVTIGLPNLDAKDGKGPELFGHRPRYDKTAWGWVYENLCQPVKFSGGLLLGAEFIRELYVHMGFHPAWKYRSVREVLFSEGRVLEDLDRSEDMQVLRDRLSKQPMGPGSEEGRESIQKWVEQCFSRDYTRG